MSKTRWNPWYRYRSACWRGAIVGVFAWGFLILGAWGFETFEPWSPEWFQNLNLPDILGSICALLAWPIPLGGWLFIWGDAGPPFPWIGNWILNIGIGASSYGLLGAMTSVLISWLRDQHA